MDQKILDALKTINDKLGGTNDPNENWGSLLQEIAQNVGSGGGGGGVFVIDYDYDTGVPTLTLGEVRAGIASGSVPMAKTVETVEGITTAYWLPVTMFRDAGADGVSMLEISGTPYMSTSGADDATWERYD